MEEELEHKQKTWSSLYSSNIFLIFQQYETYGNKLMTINYICIISINFIFI